MQPKSKYSTGIRFGIITGLVYVVLLFIKYHYFVNRPKLFFLATVATYIAVLLLYFLAAQARKKELQGYADFKDIFQSVFVTILITELFYSAFSFVYFRYVDPLFFENFLAALRRFFESKGVSESETETRLQGFDSLGRQMTPSGLVKMYASWVIIDCIIGMIYAAVLRKKKDAFSEPKP